MMSQLFFVLGCYGLGFGALSLPTALFVGPHLLAASIGHMLIGAACLITAHGLKGKRVWAWWSGLVLSLALLLLGLIALAQSVSEWELPGIVFYSLMMLYFITMVVAAIKLRASYMRPSQDSAASVDQEIAS